MKRIIARRAHFEDLRSLIRKPEALAAIHAETTIPDGIVDWLGRLKLLYGLPFNYLVPDEAMLPPESLRFFQVDLNWLYCLIEGAASLGRTSSETEAHDSLFIRRLHADSTRKARAIRKSERGASATAPDIEHITGFLLRSQVVAGWPGLEVTAYDEEGHPLPAALRFDRLSPTILLFMVEGIIGYVDIHEPPEGLHFGIDEGGKSKLMRYVTVPPNAPPGTQPGSTITTADPVPVNCRGKGVLKIHQWAMLFQEKLNESHGNDDPATGQPRLFTSAEFALQTVEGVQSVIFVNQPAT